MIRRVMAYKSGRNNTTKFKVLYNTKEITYTKENIPQTVKKFMQTHNFIKVDNTAAFFE